jgi:hypothetical protein
MGGSNAEKAIHYLYHTRSYLVKSGKSPGSCKVARKSLGSPVSIVTGLVVLQWYGRSRYHTHKNSGCSMGSRSQYQLRNSIFSLNVSKQSGGGGNCEVLLLSHYNTRSPLPTSSHIKSRWPASSKPSGRGPAMRCQLFSPFCC